MSNNERFKGPDESRQLENKRVLRRTDKWYTPFLKSLASRDVCIGILCAMAICPLFLPEYFDICRIVFFILVIYYMAKNWHPVLPLKLPQYLGIEDRNDSKPGRHGFFKASGILFLGNDVDGYELWLRDTDIKTHMLIYGTTGSGKTVSLESIAYNSYVMGTGLCYIDPKGDPKLAHELFIMARRMSREDDFLAMDFMTGGKKSEAQTPFRMSNTTNPFATAPADAITNLLTSLLPKEDGGGNSVFQQKAIGLLTALIPILAALRDAKVPLPITDMSSVGAVNNRKKGDLGSGMSIAIIRDYLDTGPCVSLVYPMKEERRNVGSGKSTNNLVSSNDPLEGFDFVKGEECDAVARLVDAPLLDVFKAALTSLNYTPGTPFQNQKTFFEQFGYAKGYFGAPLASISGMYGHLFNVSSGEIDMYDCLFNRRILVGILPSLEKSPQECENLGKIILASVKNSVSGGLGDKLEGKTKEITGALPSASKVPGIIIVDEYAAIMMPGFEVILTQARSLGFMAIIASQDYSGMKGKDAKSCDQIVENTKIKLFMTMASAKETWDLAKSLFGTTNVEEVNLNNPEDRGTIKNIDKVNQFDLMNQTEGEFHAFYKGLLIRGETRYMVPSAKEEYNMRINKFVRTDKSPELIKANLQAAEYRKDSDIDVKKDDEEWVNAIKKDIVFNWLYRLQPVGPDEEDFYEDEVA